MTDQLVGEMIDDFLFNKAEMVKKYLAMQQQICCYYSSETHLCLMSHGLLIWPVHITH